MDIPASQQAIQKHYSQLGISHHKSVQILIDLCKGRVPINQGAWFYRLFPNRGIVNEPITVEEAKNLLASAWWIEDEDLAQEIYCLTYRLQLTTKTGILTRLSVELRDYLVLVQKLFTRQNKWEETYYREAKIDLDDRQNRYTLGEYTEEDEEDFFALENSLALVLGDPKVSLSKFYRYFLYLYSVEKIDMNDMAKRLGVSTRQIKRYVKKLKEYGNYARKIKRKRTPSGRHCSIR